MESINNCICTIKLLDNPKTCNICLNNSIHKCICLNSCGDRNPSKLCRSKAHCICPKSDVEECMSELHHCICNSSIYPQKNCLAIKHECCCFRTNKCRKEGCLDKSISDKIMDLFGINLSI